MDLYAPEERERRLRIIESGITTEFWKVVRDSLTSYSYVKSQEVLSLHRENKTQEAHDLALELVAIKRIMDEPGTIIRSNKPLFDKFAHISCKMCGAIKKQYIGAKNVARKFVG